MFDAARGAANGSDRPGADREAHTTPSPQAPGADEPVVDLRGNRGLFDDVPVQPAAPAPPGGEGGDRRGSTRAAAPAGGAADGPIDPWQPVEGVWDPDRGWHPADRPGTEGPPGDVPTGAESAADGDDATGRAPAVGTRAGSLTRRLGWTLLPAVLAVLLAAGVAGAAVIRSGSLEARADDLHSAAATQRAAVGTVDALWSGVLGIVAAGVGQEVATPAQVQTLVGEVRGSDASARTAPGGLDRSTEEQLSAAADARGDLADAVDAVVGRFAGNPIEVGNELSSLAEAHRHARGSTLTAADSLELAAEAEGRAAGRLRLISVVALVLGAVAAAVALVWARRRVHDGVDLPVARVHDAVRRIGKGEPAVRSRAGGLPELAALGSDLDEVVRDLGDQLDDLRRRAEWSQQSRLIVDALDLADDEDALFEVVTRAFAVIDPPRPVELLLTDRGPSRLTVVATNPQVEPPGTPVDSAGACVALRRGQVAVFESSGSITSCPMLRQRPGGDAESGACIPVTVAGRPAGVIHMTGPEMHPPEPHVVERLVSLASQVGNRLGALRTLESTRHQATTDGLTGLPNRRSLEADVASLIERGTPFVMVIADLDKFKRLNDTYGHEVGDRALQLFAGVLRDNVRGNDLVARLGGEEFVLVYPNMSVEISIEAIGRLRAALAKAVAASPIPNFTCSYGVTHSSVGEDGDAILRIADAGLLRAKELGGDQAVFADANLAAAVFADGPGGSDDATPRGEDAPPPTAPPPSPPAR